MESAKTAPALALLGTLLPVLSLQAASRPQFVWQGEVDNVIDITIQGDSVSTITISGEPVKRSLSRLTHALPSDEVSVSMTPLASRGYVHITNYPTIKNNHVLRIRIEDLQDGPFFYRIAVSWPLKPQFPDLSPLPRRRSLRSTRNVKEVNSEVWQEEGRALKVQTRQIWSGNVNGRARLAISAQETKVLSGEADGRLQPVGEFQPLRKSVTPKLLPLTADTICSLVEAPSRENNYTLVIDVEGSPQKNSSFEIAW